MNEPTQETFFLDPEPEVPSPAALALPPHVEPETAETSPADTEPNPAVPEPIQQIRQRKTWGRVPSITKAQQDGICEHLKNGHYIETACHLLKVDKATLYAWLARAHDPLSPNHKRYSAFRDKVLAAISEGEEATLKRVREGESLDWRAAAWRLERRFPRKWGRMPTDELVEPQVPQPGEPGAPPSDTQNVTRMLAGLSPEAILDLASKMFGKPEQVAVPEDGVIIDVQAHEAQPSPEEKARTA